VEHADSTSAAAAIMMKFRHRIVRKFELLPLPLPTAVRDSIMAA
jgi:hypothetical protein